MSVAALDVVSGAGGDMAEENLFGRAAAHQHGQRADEVILRVGMFVVDRELHGETQRHAARNNGYLVQRIGAGRHRRNQRVARFVIGGIALLFFRENHGFALDAHEHFVLGHFEIRHHDKLAVLARRPQSSLVHQVGEIGAGETRCAAGDDRKVHIFGDRHFARMHAQDFLAALDIRPGHNYAPVKAAGTQQGRIEHVGAVGRGNQDDALVRFKPVHFDQQGVQRLFALVVTAAQGRRHGGGRPRQFRL